MHESIKPIHVKKRYYSIQGLRFLFSLMIINYHFYSLYLRFNDNLPNCFCRSYMADEFFFMVSGFFIAQSAMEDCNADTGWTIKYIAKRIKKIAIPYYFSWILCFIGGRVADAIAGESVHIIPNLLNSVYELLFLEMLGFNKGLYSNSVGWYFSGLIISIMLICPFLRRFRKNYILYIAPVIGGFALGMLSLHYDYLFWPSKVIPEIPVLKGMIRAYAEINLGVFIFGLYKMLEDKHLSDSILQVIKTVTCLLWISIVSYMMIPFASNFDEPAIQYDYIFAVLILLALILTFLLSSKSNISVSHSRIMEKLGRASVYIFFGQPVLYTLYKWFFGLPIRTISKFILLYIIIFAFSTLIYSIDTCAKKRVRT